MSQFRINPNSSANVINAYQAGVNERYATEDREAKRQALEMQKQRNNVLSGLNNRILNTQDPVEQRSLLKQTMAIDPQFAKTVTASLQSLASMDEKQKEREQEKQKQIFGFLRFADSPQKWEYGKQFLEAKGIDTKGYGDFDPKQRQLAVELNEVLLGEASAPVKPQLTELGVGDGKAQKAFVAPGGKTEYVGEPYLKHKPSEKKGEGGKKYGSGEANVFVRQAHTFFGGVIGPTGEFNALDPEKEKSKVKLAAEAERIFIKNPDVEKLEAFELAVKKLYGNSETPKQETQPEDRGGLRRWLSNL